MQPTPIDLAGDKYYEVYRSSLIRRHITSNGRLAQKTWLEDAVSKEPKEEAQFTNNARLSEETPSTGATTRPATYCALPVFFGNDVLLIRGDNPLLEGGLALATFAMEVLHNIDSSNSFRYARMLFSFFLESEVIDGDGNRTGFLTRRESFGQPLRNASTDELSGCLLGLFLFREASIALRDQDTKSQIEALLARMAGFLKQHWYLYVEPSGCTTQDGENVTMEKEKATAFVYMYPFSKLFEYVLGDAFLPEDTAPPPWLSAFVDQTDLLCFLAMRALSETSGIAPLSLYLTVLEGISPGEEMCGFVDSNGRTIFYDFSMTCHTVILALLNPAVSDADKAAVATAATQMLMKIMRFPEQPGFDNAYFALTAALCRQYAPPSVIDDLENAAALTPGAMDDLAVEGGSFLLDLACRASSFLSAGVGVWAAGQRKRCADWKNSTVAQAHQDGDEGRANCESRGNSDTQGCKLEGQESIQECAQTEDEGYNQCSSWSSTCSDWLPYPLDYLCDAFDWVCDAYYWVSDIVCVVWNTIVEKYCIVKATATELLCKVSATAKEWATVVGATLSNWVCQGGTWFFSGLVGLAMWGLGLLTCWTDRSWDDRIASGLQPLRDPRNVFYRDLPLSKIVQAGNADTVDFSHTNPDGEDLIGEDFTWEHKDPQHCFANTCSYDTSILTDYVLSGTVRCEAVGLDFLYPKMLLAHIGKDQLPAIEEVIYPTLPVVGASLMYGRPT
jgi:hypothetical protein